MAVDTTQAARKKMTMAKAQENLYAYNVAKQVCEVNTRDMGTIYNPYSSLPAVSDAVVTAPDYNLGTLSVDADSLQVNRRATAAEHVNSYDWKSVGFGLIADRGANFGQAISQQIDRYVVAQAVGSAGTALDDGDFGGWGKSLPLDKCQEQCERIATEVFANMNAMPLDRELNELLREFGVFVGYE